MANRKRRPVGNPARAASTARRPPATNRRQPARSTASSTTEKSPLRAWVAERSRGPVIALSRLPKLLLPAAIVLLVLVGLAGPRFVGVAALAVVAVFLGWLAFLSWPVIDSRQRTIRMVAAVVIVGAAVARAGGWL